MRSHAVMFVAGRFGTAVSRYWQRDQRPVTIVPLEQFADALNAMPSPPAFIGVAAWRRYLTEFEALDAWCWDAGVPWTTIVLEGPILRAGPLVVPGKSGCHSCYCRRCLSNSPVADRELALDAAYALDRERGPEGYTASLARLGAMLLASDCRDIKVAGGRTRWFDIRSGGLSEETLVPVHGCLRCARLTPPGTRYTALLRPALAPLKTT